MQMYTARVYQMPPTMTMDISSRVITYLSSFIPITHYKVDLQMCVSWPNLAIGC